MVKDGEVEGKAITCTRDVIDYMKELKRSDREQVICLYLNARNIPICKHVVSVGTLNASLVHPREIFKIAILKNSASFIMVHNHPSGGLEPSEADVMLSGRMKDAGKIMGIEIQDHIIVTPDGKSKSII